MHEVENKIDAICQIMPSTYSSNDMREGGLGKKVTLNIEWNKWR
jgi:hypothetical protein